MVWAREPWQTGVSEVDFETYLLFPVESPPSLTLATTHVTGVSVFRGKVARCQGSCAWVKSLGRRPHFPGSPRYLHHLAH